MRATTVLLGGPSQAQSAAFLETIHYTQPDLTKRDNAGEERLRVGGFEPADYKGIRLRFDELRDDVRIDKEPVHKSTGRG
jgi:hypothetical protein